LPLVFAAKGRHRRRIKLGLVRGAYSCQGVPDKEIRMSTLELANRNVICIRGEIIVLVEDVEGCCIEL
jgi:hypothetical protein